MALKGLIPKRKKRQNVNMVISFGFLKNAETDLYKIGRSGKGHIVHLLLLKMMMRIASAIQKDLDSEN